MAKVWMPGFVYEFVYPYPKTRGLQQWLRGEHTWFNTAFHGFMARKFMLFGDNSSATVLAHLTARWQGPIAGVPPPIGAPVVRVRDLDFYALVGSRISRNWCMIDVVDVLQQGGYRVLPPSALPDTSYSPPSASGGLLAPDSGLVSASSTAHAARAFRSMLDEDLAKQSDQARWWAENATWYGPGGIGTARSRAQYAVHFLRPLHAAFPNASVDVDMLICQNAFCGALVLVSAVHTGIWLGQPGTGRHVRLRLAVHARVQMGAFVEGCGYCGQVAEAWAMLDIPAAFAQMGVDLLARARSQSDLRISGQATGLVSMRAAEGQGNGRAEAGPPRQERQRFRRVPEPLTKSATFLILALMWAVVGACIWLHKRKDRSYQCEPLLETERC